MAAWIPGQNIVAIINKYTINKAYHSDFGFQENKNIIPCHIPDFINLPSCRQEAAKPNQEGTKKTSILPQEGAPPHNFQNQKLCSIFPVPENSKNPNLAILP